MSEELSAGDVVPGFEMQTSEGRTITLSDFSGSRLVLFFYPKDNTPGCTTEAIDFTSLLPEFKKENTIVVGVSKDSLKKHSNFIAKHELGIELGSDEDGSVCEAFGVWKEKKNYGKVYMGIERSTFLINESGKIDSVWRKVRVKEHAQTVLAAVKAL